jgi:hypothetical protein
MQEGFGGTCFPSAGLLMMLTLWECCESISEFAGDQIDIAKYYDFDGDFQLEREPKLHPQLIR